MAKKINFSIKQNELQVKILNQTTAVVGKLLKIQEMIADLEDEEEVVSLNRMLTESLIEFIDFDYIDQLSERK